MRLKDFSPPDTDTAAARAALELATTYHTQALLSHVIRSWLWAQGFAALEGRTDIDHDISGDRPNSCATCWPRLPAEVHYRVGAFLAQGTACVRAIIGYGTIAAGSTLRVHLTMVLVGFGILMVAAGLRHLVVADDVSGGVTNLAAGLL